MAVQALDKDAAEVGVSPTPKRRPLQFAPTAESDLQDIWLHIARDSNARADAFFKSLLERIDSLATFSDRYPEAAESGLYGKVVRKMSVGQYRVLYSVKDDTVWVLRIRHGARDAQTELND